MNLHEIGLQTGTDKAVFHKYTPFYSRHLSDLQTGPGILLELGVLKGDSLRMWQKWAPNLTVVGWDINPVKVPNCHTMQVDCGDAEAMWAAVDKIKSVLKLPIRCVIDDASHRWDHQHAAFETLWPHTPIYVMEDIHTSIRLDYKGTAKTPPFNKSLGRFNLEFGCPTDVRTFEGKPDDSWTAIFRKI